MIQILGKVQIEDLAKFISVFSTRGAAQRAEHGSFGAQLFKIPSDESRVMVLFDWESREAFEAFRVDPATKAAMQASGTVGPPEFTFIEMVAEFPA